MTFGDNAYSHPLSRIIQNDWNNQPRWNQNKYPESSKMTGTTNPDEIRLSDNKE